jgi:transposase
MAARYGWPSVFGDAKMTTALLDQPITRFVEPKTAEQQARAVAFRTCEQLVKQRTEAVTALRSHLYEFGHVAPGGIGYAPRLAKVIDDSETDNQSCDQRPRAPHQTLKTD